MFTLNFEILITGQFLINSWSNPAYCLFYQFKSILFAPIQVSGHSRLNKHFRFLNNVFVVAINSRFYAPLININMIQVKHSITMTSDVHYKVISKIKAQ